jgi:hypothetical protein
MRSSVQAMPISPHPANARQAVATACVIPSRAARRLLFLQRLPEKPRVFPCVLIFPNSNDLPEG